MIRVPLFRSAFSLAASMILTFVTFQQSATIPARSAGSAVIVHPGNA